MASTTLSDVNFLSAPFKDTLNGEFTDKLAFMSSGMIGSANGYITPDTGYFQKIPKWNPYAGDGTQITSGGTLTPDAMTDYVDQAVYVEREFAIGQEQWLKWIAGKDATSEFARQLAIILAKHSQRISLKVATGVMATALASTNSTGNTYIGSTISPQAVLGGKFLLGDNSGKLTDAIMHSKVYADALTDKIINWDKAQADSLNTGDTGAMIGMNPHMDDSLTATASVYPTYLGTQGSMIYLYRERQASDNSNANRMTINAGNIIVELEKYRDSLVSGGKDVVIVRYSAAFHVPGVAWSSATTNPTDAQLATGSNWTKKAETKNIPLVQIKTL